MKYKVGDKVRVKKDIKEGCNYRLYVSSEMENYKNKVMTIKEAYKEKEIAEYRLEEGGSWVWTEDMLEDIQRESNFSIGDIVIITDEGKMYRGYEQMVEGTEFYDNWQEGRKIDCKELYKVVKLCDSDICLVEKLKDKEIYIIAEAGIRKVPFNIGDKAKVLIGSWIGTSVKVVDVEHDKENTTIYKSIGVKFSRKASDRHDCKGRCKYGYGWYYSIKDLEIVEDKTKNKKPEAKHDDKEESSSVDMDEIFSKLEQINQQTVEKINQQLKSKENQQIEQLSKEVSKLTKEISTKERMQDLLNEAIIEKGKEIAIEDLKEKLKSELDEFIEEKYGVLPKKIEVYTDTSHKQLQGIFHKDFEKICKLVNANIPVMLTGGAGAGKNYTLEQVAEALDLDFYFSNAVNQEYKLTGFVDANGTYHETEFYKAFTKGGMFFLDEIDASSPECLVIMNSAIANKYFDFPTGRVKAHENFRVVCAGNTYGTGADMVYVGRNVLDGATLDRFVVVPFDYDENVEKQLAYDMELYEFIYNLRKAVNECNLRYIVSMRALINATKMLELGMNKQEILKTAIIKNMQIDDLNTIYNKLPNSDWKDELDKFIKRGDYV
ncbi:MAG: AAA family ATPase [bacterium]|nr:AAA family ATPase [bacterium]